MRTRRDEGSNMKSVIPIAASLALALAPAAYAQVTCSEVSRLIEYAKDDFDDITGEEIDDDYYKASYSLPGAAECTVDYNFDSVYYCLWVYDSYSAASAALSAQGYALVSCLSGWTPRSITPDATASAGYRMLQGTSYEGSGANVDFEWSVGLEEHTHAQGTDWHVWVDIAYLW
jgi:hypothetical protein